MAAYEVEAKFEITEDQFRDLTMNGLATKLEFKVTIDDHFSSKNPSVKGFLRIRTWGHDIKIVCKEMVQPYVRRENEIRIREHDMKLIRSFVEDDLGFAYSHSIIKVGKYGEWTFEDSVELSLAVYSATCQGKVRYFAEIEVPERQGSRVLSVDERLRIVEKRVLPNVVSIFKSVSNVEIDFCNPCDQLLANVMKP